METIKASVVQEEEKHFIEIELLDGKIRIPLCEDKPNEVKAAFNKLIARIKDGEFQLELKSAGDDLFFHVASEYITQLNREIQEVRAEMKRFGLIGADAQRPAGAKHGGDEISDLF